MRFISLPLRSFVRDPRATTGISPLPPFLSVCLSILLLLKHDIVSLRKMFGMFCYFYRHVSCSTFFFVCCWAQFQVDGPLIIPVERRRWTKFDGVNLSGPVIFPRLTRRRRQQEEESERLKRYSRLSHSLTCRNLEGIKHQPTLFNF